MASGADDSASSGRQSLLGRVDVSHHARGIAVVKMRGEHDLSTHPMLSRALERAAAHSNVVVDLSDCTFIDSTIGVLSDQAMRKIEECLKSTLGIP